MLRSFIALWLATAPFAQTPETPQPARISGRVVDLSGEPVRKAVVKLLGASIYTQAADSQGLFTFGKIVPGAYSLVAFGPGFTPQKYGTAAPIAQSCRYIEQLTSPSSAIALRNIQKCIQGAPGATLSLAAATEIKDLTIRLTRRAKITGRVLNRDGEPVARWTVQLIREVYSAGGRRWEAQQTSMGTDIDGNYALADVAPGRCYLYAVNAFANAFAGLESERAGGGAEEIDLPAFFPGAGEASGARPMDVKPGAELAGLDIFLPRGRVFAIRGKLLADRGAGLSDQILNLSAKDGPRGFMNQRSSRVYADGSFEFADVPPGNYVISGGRAWGNAGAAAALYVRTEVTVSGENIEGLSLTPVPMIQMTGSVKMEEGEAREWPALQLSDPPGDLNAMAEPDENGNLLFRSRLAPIAYIVSVLRLPAGTYVKAMHYGNQDLLHAPLDLSGAGGGSIEVVLSRNVAAIKGSVENASGERAPGVVVSVWPRVQNVTGSAVNASTDQNGDFEISDLAPGRYFVAAWENVDPAVLENPDFLSRFQNAAAEVALEERGQAKTDLKLIPARRVAEESEKLP